MEAQLEQIREQQKATWNKFSPGWRKWDDFTMGWLKPMGTAIIRALELEPTDRVLDIASGTGEPGLTIAGMVPRGAVVLTDLSEGMLEVARDKAVKNGIRNITTQVCDVSELPFADNSFDAVSCRFGFMFFPDMQLAIRELVRVLKPGGILATSVWGIPEKNFWITAIMGTIHRNMQLPAPPSTAPGMFRCAPAGLMAELFWSAGLTDVAEKEVAGRLDCGSTGQYWTFMNEVAAPVVSAMAQADAALQARIREEVFAVVARRYPDGRAALDYSAQVISGRKP